MSKHTPGPWVYDLYQQPGGNRAHITTVAHCCDYVIGLPSSYPGGNYRDGDPSGHPEADARLIAAAPDLLAALERLVDRNLAYFDGYVMRDQISLDDVMSARAAIARAKGEA